MQIEDEFKVDQDADALMAAFAPGATLAFNATLSLKGAAAGAGEQPADAPSTASAGAAT